MTISQLGSLGEFLSSIAVLITLVYLAMQIRQNTSTTRAVSHHAITDALNQLNLTIATDDQAAQIWLTGMQDRSSLTAIQREKYDALLRAYLHICDTMYYQAQIGAGDDGLWKAEERYLAVILSSNGGKQWLAENSLSISSGFRAAIESILEHSQRSGSESFDPMSMRYGAAEK